MTGILATLVLPAAVSLLVLDRLRATHVERDLIGFFSDNLRVGLFGGFLALAGLLLSLKTFIIVEMQKGPYENKDYRKRVAKRFHARGPNAQALHPLTELFLPLRRLSDLLFAAILFSTLTAVAQVTIGLVESWWAVAVCVGASVSALLVLAWVLLEIRGNLRAWFRCLEDDAQKIPPEEVLDD